MSNRKREQQRRIAYEAARILTEHQSDNIAHVCRKVAAKYGITHAQMMPSLEEVEIALREQQWLVRGDKQSEALQQLRLKALDAMQAFHQFHPQLVGSVLHGTADRNSHIELHLYADTPEDVLFSLSDLQIPWQEMQRTLTFSDGSQGIMPGFQFNADDVTFRLIIFPIGNHHKHPLDPINNRPLEGASLKQLRAILQV
ncbi:MAG: hypothetical protein P8179_07980 [Candidatus Thiodiazotropha sp.]|jgi:hypothetical protein